MENEKLQVVLGEKEQATLIIREGKAPDMLPILPPVKVNINGTLGAVAEFLSKRKDTEQIDQKLCHILVNREDITITLITAENDGYESGKVEGKLAIHPKFDEFGINTGKVWTPIELGMFFKMNRSFFESQKENMDLVTRLKHFTATVNSSIERMSRENGDKTDNFSQVVNSNLPESFKLVIPIFKGRAAETIEVETFARISGREVAFILLSPGANQVTEDIRDKAIDEQIAAIREICPDIAIIEQ